MAKNGSRVPGSLILLGVGAATAALVWQGSKPLKRALRIRENDDGAIEARQAVTVAREPAEVYAYWRDLTNLPTFARHVERVEVLNELESRWWVKAPTGLLRWDATIIADEPPTVGGVGRLGWRTLPGTGVTHDGEVRFRPAPGGRGTEVSARLAYHVPGGAAVATLTRLFQLEPNQAARDDLMRLKRQLEMGFQPTTEGQSSGRAKTSAKQTPNDPPSAATPGVTP